MNKTTRLPTIGITTLGQNEFGHYRVATAYVEAVRLAGGLPILLPPGETNPAAIVEIVDGFIFTGGGDIDPVAYNGSPHPMIGGIDPQRDAFELSLAQLVLNTDIPVLGICRGLEVLVVMSGGTLVPHVPDQFGEKVAHAAKRLTTKHLVRIASESHLAQILGTTEATVVSWHHQAASKLPSEWQISAYSADGVIEAIEHVSHPWAIALQWHPELALNDPLQQRIFQSFVRAAHTQKIGCANQTPNSTVFSSAGVQ